MSDLKEGDLVELKSGSPPMTLESIGVLNGVKKAQCQWFDEKHKLQSGSFALTSLQSFTPGEPVGFFGVA